MKKKNIWSLKIPIKNNLKDVDIKKFFKVCEIKLGFVPNIIKTNSIDKKIFISLSCLNK